MVNRKIIGLILFVALSLSGHCQRGGSLYDGEMLVGAGMMMYSGDLNNQSLLSTPHVAYSLALRYPFDNRIAIVGGISYGTIEGGNPDYIALRNLSFRNNIFEASVIGEFSFWRYRYGTGSKQWTPYLFAGVGYFHHNPRAMYLDDENNEVWIDLQPLRTEGQGSSLYPKRTAYSLNAVCLPIGLGIKAQISKSISISVQYGVRFTWTDYLDDVSTTYVSNEVLQQVSSDFTIASHLADRSNEVEEGYVNAAGIKRGDDSLNDWYSIFSVNIGISLDTLLGWTRTKRCTNE